MLIGIVRLAPGNAAYYDDLTNIHLTVAMPEAPVYSGMNTTKLKVGVAFGTIKLVSGSLDTVTTKQAVPYVPPVKQEVSMPVQEVEKPKAEEQVKLNTEPKTEPKKTASEPVKEKSKKSKK